MTLTWVKNEPGEYVATLDDGRSIVISKDGSRKWDLGTLAPGADHEEYVIFDLRTLSLAKIAGEVCALHGVEPVKAHKTDCRSKLIGGGWGGWSRSYGSKVTCSCGYSSGENVGSIEDARDLAAYHQQGAWEALLDA